MFFRYALLNLFRRKGRTLYAVVGIAISISVVVAVVSATRGLEQGLVSMLKQFRGDLIIYDHNVIALSDSRLDEDLGDKLRDMPGIHRLNPYIIQVLRMSFAGFDKETLGRFAPTVGKDPRDFDKLSQAAPILAFPPDAFVFENEAMQPVKGTIRFSAPDAREIILGERAWQQAIGLIERMRAVFNLDDQTWNGLRKTYFDETFGLPRPILNGQEFRVIGVYRTGSMMDNQMVVPMLAYQQIDPSYAGKVTAFLALIDRDSDIERISRQIRDEHPTLMPLDPRDLVNQFGDEYAKLQLLILAIGVIASVGGAVSVLNTMASNVHERIREIGLLRSVGWTRKRMIFSILTEGAAIATIGGLIGCGLGLIELRIVEQIIGTDPNPQGLELHVFVIAMLISIGLGLFGSLLPAWRASRLSPVEALRDA
ncbi:MAG: ABC transporter permease [Planctomycetota bacterium]